MPWSPNGMETAAGGDKTRRRRGGIRLSAIVDLEFLKSLGGVLLIVEVVCMFLGLVLGRTWRNSYSGCHVFFVLIMIFGFLSALSLLVCRTIRLHELIKRDINWDLVLLCYSAGAAVLVLIASCLMVEAAKEVSVLKAAGVFGLFAWNALLASTILYGRPVWRDRVSNMPPSATATVSPGQAPPSAGDQNSSEDDEEWSDDDNMAVPESDAPSGVTLTQAKPRPTSVYGNISHPIVHAPTYPSGAVSHSSLYPVDVGGSKRTTAVYNPTTETWTPG